MYICDKEYDVIIVGAGHAGCEAALACARRGCSTLLLTLNLDNVAHMPCNPAIGGLGKSHLVREIDALGGQMARVIDQTGIQFRMLNTSKGVAVQALRAQADKVQYKLVMKRILEQQPGLDIKQALVERLLAERGRIQGVVTQDGAQYGAKAVILATGTFLNGLIHIGLEHFPAGRAGEFPAIKLTDSLKELGFELKRLKTGTPPRLNARSIDYSALEPQPGDEAVEGFSFATEGKKSSAVPCYLTYTNPKTHEIIRRNLDKSPLYQGIIKGIGPRYCPSIEDKVVRFADKNRHQVFLEPEGLSTLEIYANGVSTSLPLGVQVEFLRSIEGLERVEIMRPGYAIEYDFVPPTQLKPTLETKLVEGLYHAGQINGTSGYEEAAAQGLYAAINAVNRIHGRPDFVPKRSECYMAVMVDDLVTQGVLEPYRMFTSRAEYRLLLRQDNADLRLMKYGYEFGLISQGQYSRFMEKQKMIADEIQRLRKTRIKVGAGFTPAPWGRVQDPPLQGGTTLAQFLKRPEVSYSQLAALCPDSSQLPDNVTRQVELEIKYEGYIQRQLAQAGKLENMEDHAIPPAVDYHKIPGLSTEIRQRLSQVRPISLGQASRIPGITPAAMAILMVYLKSKRT